ncbi:MAG: hypothetical protein ACYC8T_11190 [Myxococcaceae bacterium]
MRANLFAGCLAVLWCLAAGCGEPSPSVEPGAPEEAPADESPAPGSVAPPSAALPGLANGPAVPFSAGPQPTLPGPWPLDPVRDYSRDFGLARPQSVAFDEALNLWLLDKDRIGVLRPGDKAPRWTQGVGQAGEGFGIDALATGATVICGGEPGRAYVGYSARDLQNAIPGKPHALIPWPGEAWYTPERFAEYQKGDMDAVRLNPDGSITLEEHLWRTVGLSNKDKQIGIHNTNDFHYDEDRSIRKCERVTRGSGRGSVYVTTNHGVTRIDGLVYNSHRHPGWYLMVPLPEGGFDPILQTTEMYGLGIAPNGDVLVANEQMVGVLVPSPRLEDWDRELTWDGPTPWRFKGHNPKLGDEGSFDYWRAFEQTTSGRYYLGSLAYGLWSLEVTWRSSGTWTRVTALPASRVLSLQATDDGALYVGTDGAGLWRLEADGTTLARVPGVAGQRVLELGYEPTVLPPMLLVLTERGLTVLRGP